MEKDERYEKLINKVKKLLRKADSTDSPEEAESLLVKASTLMMRYKIKESEVEEEKEFEIKVNQSTYAEISLEGKWETALASKIAKYQDCKITWRTNTNKLTFYGDEHDVKMSIYFYEQARAIFRSLSRKEYNAKKNQVKKDYPDLTLRQMEKIGYISYRSVYVRSFLYGAAAGLGKKLSDMKRQILEEEASEQYGLMILNQIEKINMYLTEKVKPKKNGNSGATGDREAMLKGYESGQKHNLAIGVETDSKGGSGKQIA